MHYRVHVHFNFMYLCLIMVPLTMHILCTPHHKPPSYRSQYNSVSFSVEAGKSYYCSMAADDAKKPAAKVPTLKKQASVGNISEEIEDDLSTLPNMKLSQLHFLLRHQHSGASTLSAAEAAAAKQQVLELAQQSDMAPFYRLVCAEFQWPEDAALEAQMSAKNAQELAQLDERLADAEQNLGDIEVLEALLAKARMFSRVGDKEKALEAFKVAGEKPQSINQKILVALHVIRIGLFFSDLELVETHIKKATAYVAVS